MKRWCKTISIDWSPKCRASLMTQASTCRRIITSQNRRTSIALTSLPLHHNHILTRKDQHRRKIVQRKCHRDCHPWWRVRAWNKNIVCPRTISLRLLLLNQSFTTSIRQLWARHKGKPSLKLNRPETPKSELGSSASKYMSSLCRKWKNSCRSFSRSISTKIQTNFTQWTVLSKASQFHSTAT